MPTPQNPSSIPARLRDRGYPTDLVAPLLGALALILAAWNAGRRPFWTDECLTWFVAADPSLASVLAAAGDDINTAPPLYFVASWLWSRAFGASELALRMFTTLGFSTGLFVAWLTLRRAFGRTPAAVATLLGFLACGPLVVQNLQARFYGMLFAEVCLAVWLATVACRRERPSRGVLVATALVHGALVTTHYFGFVYSGTILAATALAWLGSRRPHPSAVLAAALGWLAFVPCLPAFLRHVEKAGPAFWVPRPRGNDLVAFYGEPVELLLAVGASALMMVLILSGAKRVELRLGRVDEGRHAARRVLTSIAVLVGAIPAVIWILSRDGTSLFLDRYLFPSVLAPAIALAWVLRALISTVPARWRSTGWTQPWLRRLAEPIAYGGLVLALASTMPGIAASERARPRFSLAGLPKDVPLVLESSRDLPWLLYSDAPERFVFVLDAELTEMPAHAKRTLNDLQILSALGRHYPSVRTTTTAELFRTQSRFAVLDKPEHPWFEERVAQDLAWTVERDGPAHGWALVRRTGLAR